MGCILRGIGTFMMTVYMHMYFRHTATRYGGIGMYTGEFTDRDGALRGDGGRLGIMVGTIHSGMVLIGAAIGDRHGTIIRIMHTMEDREDGGIPDIPIAVLDAIRRGRLLHITAIIRLHMVILT